VEYEKMAELTADERIKKIAIDCLDLLENRLKDKSSQVDIKTTAETLKALADVLERYKETVEKPQESAYQQARRRVI
jgi:vacuolar-type H+-ATPase subunit C/Vma6